MVLQLVVVKFVQLNVKHVHNLYHNVQDVLVIDKILHNVLLVPMVILMEDK